MTVDDVLDSRSADDESVDCGYEPELKRTLGPFQVFAISFAFISVAVGVFATYDAVLQTAGPVGIWLWVVAAVGQTLVALVVPSSRPTLRSADRPINGRRGWRTPRSDDSSAGCRFGSSPPARWRWPTLRARR